MSPLSNWNKTVFEMRHWALSSYKYPEADTGSISVLKWMQTDCAWSYGMDGRLIKFPWLFPKRLNVFIYLILHCVYSICSPLGPRVAFLILPSILPSQFYPFYPSEVRWAKSVTDHQACFCGIEMQVYPRLSSNNNIFFPWRHQWLSHGYGKVHKICSNSEDKKNVRT